MCAPFLLISVSAYPKNRIGFECETRGSERRILVASSQPSLVGVGALDPVGDCAGGIFGRCDGLSSAAH